MSKERTRPTFEDIQKPLGSQFIKQSPPKLPDPPKTVEKVVQKDSTKADLNQFINVDDRKKKVQVSIYLDSEVRDAFNVFGNKHGKGAKSELVNNFLRQVLDI